MKNQIKFSAAGALLVLFLAGCGTDRALCLDMADGRDTDAVAGFQAELPGDDAGADAEGSGTIYVHVCGAVKTPKVVTLPAGSRGCDAVAAAGGFAADAAEDAVNLAKCLEDGERLYIPSREEAAEAEKDRQAQESGLVDINRADAAQLCTLPGIGAARADAIIAYREANGGFKAAEDIMKVPGIKEAAFAKIKDKITVEQ